MKTLMVYGYKRKEKAETGRTNIKCLFYGLFPSPLCIANAKRTAEETGHEITRVELSVEWDAPFKDVTEQFMKGRIEE